MYECPECGLRPQQGECLLDVGLGPSLPRGVRPLDEDAAADLRSAVSPECMMLQSRKGAHFCQNMSL